MDYTIIEKLKSNELELCKNWSDLAIELNNSVYILANENLKGDYFLNRVVLTNGRGDSSKEEKEILSIVSSLKEISKKQIPDVYIHINDTYSSLKSIFEKNGFREIDKLIGLVRVVNDHQCFSSKEFEVQKNDCQMEKRIRRSIHPMNWMNGSMFIPHHLVLRWKKEPLFVLFFKKRILGRVNLFYMSENPRTLQIDWI